MFIVYATQSVVLCYISPKLTSCGPYKWEMPVKCLLSQIRLNCFNIKVVCMDREKGCLYKDNFTVIFIHGAPAHARNPLAS